MSLALTGKRIEVNMRDIYSTSIGIKPLLFDKFKKTFICKMSFLFLQHFIRKVEMNIKNVNGSNHPRKQRYIEIFWSNMKTAYFL